MKTKSKIIAQSGRRNWMPPSLNILLALAALLGQNVRAANITWSGGVSENGTSWTNTLYWTGGVVPGSADNAIFNTTFTGSPITVNMNPTTTVQVGAVTLGTSASIGPVIKCQSTGPAVTTLNLDGVGGGLLTNLSTSYLLTFVNTNTINGNLLNLGLGNSGNIYASTTASAGQPPPDNGAGEIQISCNITGSGSITNVGPGILYFNGTNGNSYTGSTTLSAGTLELNGIATVGDGTGTLYLSGGNLETGGSSTTRLIANPIVVNAPGNTYIYNKSGTAGTRVFAFSGGFSGTSGTLAIVNLNTTVGEYLDVQLRGSFTFNQPLVVGDSVDPYWSENYPSDYSELQLANSASAGSQTFNGNISGDGPIFRGNVTSVSVAGDNGTTIFTGSNSYTGGTVINNGTLFANNATGSALGSGAVTVTNTGILGGTGIIVAPIMIGPNGTIQPGASSTSVGNLTISNSLTFNPEANYTWQIASATGTAGTAWDLLTCGSGWTDAGGTPAININVTSQGVPTGWNDANSYSWLIVSNNGSATGFNASHWAVSTTGFGGAVAGVFGVATDANGDLLLTYTPSAGNLVIDVESGSVNQGGVSPTPYPVITGLYSVVKVGNGEVIMTNSLNSYEGTTYIDAGTASAAVNSTTAGGAFGASTAPLLLGNTFGNSNATLNIDQPGVSVANALTVQAGSTGVKTIGTTITSGGATYSGNVILNDNVTLNAAAGGSNYFSGNFSGAGGITFAGGGTITMAGLGSYSGTTTVSGGGSLDLNASALGTNTFTISALNTLDNTSGGNVTILNNPPQNWNTDINFAGSASLNLGTGPVTMSANRTLSITNNVLTVAGTIAGTGYGLTKAGAGELSLAGAASSTYTGGTTNLAGILAVNGTATLGDGTGPLVLAGGNLLDTGSRAGAPIANPVQLTTTTRIYGNSTDTSTPNRFLPFTGPFTVTGGSSLYIDNVGSAKTIFNLSLQGTNYTTINWPIVIGDPGFDTSGALTVLNLINDNTTPIQTINGLISGTGSIIRGANILNTGGTTILTQQNTFSGGVALDAGAIGLGASSITNSGGLVSGPLGTGLFTLGTITAETNLTIFATSGYTEIDNALFINGDTNIVFAGANNMLFTGSVNSGGVAKTLTVANGITVTLSGAITNTGSSTGGALIKAGGGILVFSGASTYAGTTTVNAGTLLVNGAIGTNTVTVNSAGTLGGTGALGGNLTFASGGAQAYLFKTAGSPDSPLTVASNLTLNANTVIVDLGGTTTLGTGTYTLLTYGGTLAGSFSSTPTIVNGSLAAGIAATISLTTPNEVNLVVAPASTTPPSFPPGSLGLLPSGNLSLTSTGALGTTYRLWGSTNLAFKPVTTTWTLLNSGTITASPFTNLDLTATNYAQRFYMYTTP